MRKIIQIFVVLSALAAMFASCDENKSYAELLDEEDEAIDAFFVDKILINEVPADSVFITLKDVPNNDTALVPYYKMDKDGNTYMQVLNAGDMDNRFIQGEDVNIRYKRVNLKALMSGSNPTPEGNINPMNAVVIRFGNTSLPGTTQYGLGVQVPLMYLGDECEVNMVIRSKYGFSAELTYVLPYLFNTRYYKSKS